MKTKNIISKCAEETNSYTNALKQMSNSIGNYKRLGIDIEELDNGSIKVSQTRLINGFILNQKQLIERGKELYPDKRIVPVVYSLDVSEITIPWIDCKMKELGIKRNDIIKQLAIDKSSLSLIMSGERELSKPMRATFYYYFLTYELNRDFREYINNE